MTMMKRGAAALAIGLALVFAGAASAADVKGSKDFPLVGRYEGSSIVGYQTTAFDSAKLLVGPFSVPSLETRTGAGWQAVEGRQTLIYYSLPTERSSLEVLRNYEASIAAKGGTVVFSCDSADFTCFEGGANEAAYLLAEVLGPALSLPKLDGDYVQNWFGQRARYALATFDGAEGKIYAQIFLGEGGPNPVAVVRVVETKAMEGDKITFVDASAMRKSIDETGRIGLYGILFDFDKATIKPESKPTLDEISALLNNDPTLKLLVVGHTDAKGTFAYNLDLSSRRAAAVIAALVRDYGIEKDRLAAFGCSSAAPVASNDDEAGRAKNRRVELVKQGVE